MTEHPELERLREMVFTCNRCGACREKFSADMTEKPAFRVCPVREHDGGFEHQCARGRLTIAQALLDGELGYSAELIDSIYTDPDCGLCTWVCDGLPLLDPVAVWRAMRRDIAASGGLPEPLRERDSRILALRNTFGARADRARWARELDLPREGALLYFAGCYASYTQKEIARATVAILRHVGAAPAYLGELEWCCGVTQFHDGSVGLAEDVARHNVAEIEASGATKVVTSCAECFKTLKLEYPALVGDLPFEVVHSSEFFAELLREGSIRLEAELPEARVTFHDPCHLGRHGGVFEAPRSLLAAIPGVELVEMKRHRDYAWCCGYGADMVSCMRPDLASRIAGDRMAEAREAGAEALVTACPRCSRGLSKASGGSRVYDLAVALATSMRLSF
jgi:heterodisulfide reductase subunit D